MCNECSLIKDILPLYAEKLTSAETRSIVEEHLKYCETCRREYEALLADENLSESIPAVESGEFEEVRAIKKKLRKRINVTALILALFILVAGNVVYLLIGGAIEGAKMKKQLDGAMFEKIEEDGLVVRTIRFDNNRAYVKDTERVLDDAGSLDYEKILTEYDGYYWAIKNPPGRNGVYQVSWFNRNGFFNGSVLRVLVDNNGKPMGLESVAAYMGTDSEYLRIK